MYKFLGKNIVGGRGAKVTNASTGTVEWTGNLVLVSTAASKKYVLRAPSFVGQELNVWMRAGTTIKTAWLVLPTGYQFQRTSNSTGATYRKAIFNAGNQAMHLCVISTSRIAYRASSGVTVGTS